MVQTPRMFDARSDAADEHAFAELCEEDRHHFRFIISREDAADMTDLFTRGRRTPCRPHIAIIEVGLEH
jgi:type IV secretory pathway VirD2 relaxase